MITQEQHEEFLGELRRGRHIELLVAVMLLEEGFGVRFDARRGRDRATPDEPYLHSEIDVTVEDYFCIDVKGLSYEFTSPADWPFGYGAYTWTLDHWNRPGVRHPDAFVFYSYPTGGIVTTSGRRREQWTERDSGDRRRPGYSQVRLVAPKNLLRTWEQFVGHLRKDVDEHEIAAWDGLPTGEEEDIPFGE